MIFACLFFSPLTFNVVTPFMTIFPCCFFPFLDNSITGQTKLPNNTSSPKSSPEAGNVKITEISSSKDDDDLDNDNENISVTGSPEITCDGDVNETKTEGAFTSIIQKNHRKSEFTSQFSVNTHFTGSGNPMINQALAAHLFFQNPLLPQPNQWLYNHLYNNYHDFPWLRHTLGSNTTSNGGTENSDNSRNDAASSSASGLSFIKRSITLLTNNNSNDKENDSDVQSSSSPPVSSTKRSPSPEIICESPTAKRKRSTSVESITKENVNEINRKTENFITRGRIVTGVKQNDVWRPY
jgi:hypothetical protein